MTLSTFALIRPFRLDPALELLWGSAGQLVVVVSPSPDEPDFLIAYGIDPEHVNPEVDMPVFERMLRSDGLGVFLSVLVGGPDFSSGDVDPTLLGFSGEGSGPVIANAVDVSNSQPPAPGPKLTVVFALASSIADDHSLAAVDRYAA